MPLLYNKCHQNNVPIPLTTLTIDTHQKADIINITVKLYSENRSGPQSLVKNYVLTATTTTQEVYFDELNLILDGLLMIQGKLVLFQGWVKTKNLTKIGSVQGIVKILL